MAPTIHAHPKSRISWQIIDQRRISYSDSLVEFMLCVLVLN